MEVPFKIVLFQPQERVTVSMLPEINRILTRLFYKECVKN